jgi:hypothetical protein
MPDADDPSPAAEPWRVAPLTNRHRSRCRASSAGLRVRIRLPPPTSLVRTRLPRSGRPLRQAAGSSRPLAYVCFISGKRMGREASPAGIISIAKLRPEPTGEPFAPPRCMQNRALYYIGDAVPGVNPNLIVRAARPHHHPRRANSAMRMRFAPEDRQSAPTPPDPRAIVSGTNGINACACQGRRPRWRAEFRSRGSTDMIARAVRHRLPPPIEQQS